jgi:hypothetical protein
VALSFVLRAVGRTDPANPKEVPMTADDIQEMLAEHLPKNVSQKRRDALTAAIGELLDDGDGDLLGAVDIEGARCAVERVEAFGLELELDANGNASTVHFPFGAIAA